MRKIIATAFALLITASALATNLHDIVTKGSTDRSVTVDIIDSTDGTPETGVVFNTSGIDLWYRREGAASVDVTEATLAALTTAHTDGGFLHVNDGTYRLDLPDAAFATGANYVDFGGTVTGMIVIGGRVRLIDTSLEVANLTANVITVEGTDATNVLGTAQTGDAYARLGAPAGASIAADIVVLDNFVDDLETRLGTPSNLGGGATVAGNLSDIEAQTDDIGAAGAGLTAIDLPNQTMDISGTITTVTNVTNGVNATSISGDSGAADALEAAFDGTAGAVSPLGIARQGTAQSASSTGLVLDSSAAFADDTAIGMTLVACGSTQGYCQSRAVTDNALSGDAFTVDTWTVTPSGTITYYLFSTAPSSGGGGLDAAGVRSAIGLASANLDTQLGTIDSNVDAILVDTGTTLDDLVDDLESRLGTPSNLGGGATVAANLSDIEGQTDDIGVAGAGLTAADDSVMTRLGAPAGASVSADVAAVKSDTAAILVDTGTTLDDLVDDLETRLTATRAGYLDNLSAGAVATASALTTVDTVVDTIQVTTDKLDDTLELDSTVYRFTANSLETAPTGSGESLDAIADAVWDELLSGHAISGSTGAALTSAAAGGGLDAAGVRAAIGLATANLDTQLADIPTVSEFNARTVTSATYATATALQTVDDNVDAILVDTGTTLQGEVDGIQADTEDLQTQIGAAGAGLSGIPWNASWDAEVQSEATDALNALTLSEPAAVPTWGSSTLAQWVAWIGAWSRNEIQQSTTTKTLRNDADSGAIATCAVSDDGTTFQVSECATP